MTNEEDVKFRYVLTKSRFQEYEIEAKDLDEAWEKVNANPEKYLLDESYDEDSDVFEIEEV